MRLDTRLQQTFACHFFFFFGGGKRVFMAVFSFQWVLCTVYEIHKPLYLTTFSLKMGHTALFTYLKIIMLQYFQFQ